MELINDSDIKIITVHIYNVFVIKLFKAFSCVLNVCV